MHTYELMYIIPAKVNEEEKQTVIDRVNAAITNLGGVIKDHALWMSRKLSYPINNIRQGIFILAHITIPQEMIEKLKRELELDDIIIRHLFVAHAAQSLTKPTSLRHTTLTLKKGKVEKQQKDEKVSTEELDKKLEELLSDEVTVK